MSVEATAPARRSAHPYRDLHVIDERAPRTVQTFIGTLSLVALLTQTEWIVALLGLQLIIGLTLGRQYCLPCLFYFEVLQPRLGEGRIEDSGPPRLANQMGAAFLSTAGLLFALGATTAGWVLTGVVCVLALLAATTGFCLGCWMHRRIHGECEVCV